MAKELLDRADGVAALEEAGPYLIDGLVGLDVTELTIVALIAPLED